MLNKLWSLMVLVDPVLGFFITVNRKNVGQYSGAGVGRFYCTKHYEYQI